MSMNDDMNRETLEVDGHKYVLTSIPAFKAQKIFLACAEVFTNKRFADLPDDTVLALLRYVKPVNANGAEVAIETAADIDGFFPTMDALLQVELAMIKKNFGFLFNGGLQSMLETLLVLQAPAADAAKPLQSA